MANDNKKKTETKPEAKAEAPAAAAASAVVDAAPATNGSTNGNGNGHRSTALVLVKAGIKVATPEEMSKLEEDVFAKLDALNTLLANEALPEDMRNRLMTLVEQAQPVKPGMEEMETRGDIPRVNICQPTSQKASRPEAAKPGDLYTDSGALLEKPFQFIPIYFHEENVLFPQGSKAPECKAPDGKYGMPYGLCAGGNGIPPCPNLPFGKQNGGQGEQKKSECFGQTVVTVLTMDLQNIYDIPFAKTSYSAGRALARLARGQKVAWMQSYLLDTEKKSGEKGLYYIAKVAPTSKNNGADVLKVGEAFSELYKAQRKRALAEFYQRAAASSTQAVHAEKEFQRGSIDVSDDGAEPDVMPDAGAGVRSGKPM